MSSKTRNMTVCAAERAQPPKRTTMTLRFCLMGAISLVQWRLGRFRSIRRPNAAISTEKAWGRSSRMAAPEMPGRRERMAHTPEKARGTPVRQICSRSLARRASQGRMGRDCTNQRAAFIWQLHFGPS